MKNKFKQFIGTWKGDDLKECLAMVYASRSKFYLGDDMSDAEFNKFKEKLKEQKGLPISISCNHCWDYQKYLKEENEKLKAENDRLTQKVENQRNEIIIFTCKYRLEHALRIQTQEIMRDEYSKLKAENQQLTGNSGQLKIENDRLKKDAMDWKQLSEQARETLKFCIGLKKQVIQENAQLKAQLQSKFKAGFKIDVVFSECYKSHTAEDVINCFTCLPKWYKELQEYNEVLSKAYRRRVKKIDLLNVENTQLKEQLQTCDKTSQVERKQCNKCNGNRGYYISEDNGLITSNLSRAQYINCADCNPERKPHKCPYCHGMREIWHIVVCSICDGTGIVWEPK
jgi:regulator of replication initiation timing